MIGRIAICLILALPLPGCFGPDEAAVAADFKLLFAQEVAGDVAPVVSSIGAGEGDAANVYMHVVFDVLAKDDSVFRSGWLKGRAISKGVRLSGGELVILYQKSEDGRWERTRHRLARLPSAPALGPE